MAERTSGGSGERGGTSTGRTKSPAASGAKSGRTGRAGSGRTAGATGDGRAGASGAPKKGVSGAKAAPRTKQPDLKKDLRDFASGRPQGWGHEDWLNFLESLQHRGHDIGDREAIGVALEKERLDLALGGIKGIGPQKRQALAAKYATLWDLRNADPNEIARVAAISTSVAERLKSELH